jgi:transposase-like protein
LDGRAQVGLCECGDLTGYRSGLCARCRMKALNQDRRKYRWTPELREELRRAYRQANKATITAALDRLEGMTGWPRKTLTDEARKLGIATRGRARGWTDEEVEYLRERAGAESVYRLARKLKRSVWAVRGKAQRIQWSLRVREGYNMQDLERAFGVDYGKVASWMRRGLFGRSRQLQGLRVSEASVIRFLRDHSAEYELRRVDEEWFKSMTFGYLSDVR